MQEQHLRRRFAQFGQEHVFQLVDRLPKESRTILLQQLADVDLEQIRSLFQTKENILFHKDSLQPIHNLIHPEHEIPNSFRRQGEEHLRANKVGVILVAGGQASRLGIQGPKGVLPISPQQGKSLFQLHAEKILATQRRYACSIPFYIMTSQENHSVTVEFFEKHRFFGLSEKNITFFPQGLVPTLSLDGKLLFESPHQLYLNPDGHGGLLAACAKQGILQDAKQRGIETIYYFQVDNPLAKIADPYFLGAHLSYEAKFSLKLIRKLQDEKVGVPYLIQKALEGENTYRIVEYYDLPKDKKADWGNIAIHAFAVDWLLSMQVQIDLLPWHKAKKQVQVVDETGKSKTVDAIKFERLIFDLLPHAPEVCLVETKRAEEFAPVKNKEGADSPATSKSLQAQLFASWVQRTGLPAPKTHVQGYPDVEISPLFALDEQEFVAKVKNLSKIPNNYFFHE